LLRILGRAPRFIRNAKTVERRLFKKAPWRTD
jgi:hypothetical protein